VSILKRLFGSGGGDSGGPSVPAESYAGYTIFVEPQRDGPRWRLAARIEKEIDGALHSHLMIRADTFESAEAAVGPTLTKAKKLIDEQGDTIFRKS